LSFDRFGIGNSSHADPYNVVQGPAEVSALYNLYTVPREGTVPDVGHAFNESGTIVNVGHSFGSQQSYMLILTYANFTDAINLTGFSFNGSWFLNTMVAWNSRIAAYNAPTRFGNIDGVAAFRPGNISPANITSTEVDRLLNAYGLSQSEIVV
jgi:pimeloyl-ACP methyl ester carboxylesterase